MIPYFSVYISHRQGSPKHYKKTPIRHTLLLPPFFYPALPSSLILIWSVLLSTCVIKRQQKINQVKMKPKDLQSE